MIPDYFSIGLATRYYFERGVTLSFLHLFSLKFVRHVNKKIIIVKISHFNLQKVFVG